MFTLSDVKNRLERIGLKFDPKNYRIKTVSDSDESALKYKVQGLCMKGWVLIDKEPTKSNNVYSQKIAKRG